MSQPQCVCRLPGLAVVRREGGGLLSGYLRKGSTNYQCQCTLASLLSKKDIVKFKLDVKDKLLRHELQIGSDF